MQRRTFLHYSGVLGATQLALLGCRDLVPKSSAVVRASADGIVEVPEGFVAIVLQRTGDLMTDGNTVGGQPDGMACFSAPDGSWVLLRNHELGAAALLGLLGTHRWIQGASDQLFAGNVFGGVSRVVLDPARLQRALAGELRGSAAIASSNAVLGGTDRNCAGGEYALPDSRGWVTCEESDALGHGFAFFTRTDDAALVDARSRWIPRWGRFKREGVAFDPTRGAIYMTEDDAVGLFYRFDPVDRSKPFDAGTLRAMTVEDLPHSDPSATGAAPLKPGTSWKVRWIPIPDPEAATQRCREQGANANATPFNRSEGIAWDRERDRVVFIASTAGPQQAGQVWSYSPAQERITLVAQVEDRGVLSMPDNVTVAPWGDLVMAEDNYDRRGIESQYVRGMRPDGSVYDILRNRNDAPHGGLTEAPGAEFAGCCFSPDGKVLFVNLQSPENVTLAMTGPWSSLARG